MRRLVLTLLADLSWSRYCVFRTFICFQVVSDGEARKLLPEVKEVTPRRDRQGSQSSSNPALGVRQGATLQQKARGGT